jgi:hypothetical protein
MPKLLIGAGVVLILVGLAWLIGERFGLGRSTAWLGASRSNGRT